MTPEQAQNSPHKNLITRALGVQEPVQVEINEHRVELGDVYLMCSDGLSDMLTDEAMAAILGGAGTLEQKARRWWPPPMPPAGATTFPFCWPMPRMMKSRRGLLSRMLRK